MGNDNEAFPRPIGMVQGQDLFRSNEVGLTHPDTSAFIRLRDNGDIEIVGGEGLAIIMHPAKRSITFVADSVKFLTKGGSTGLVWNKQAFNENANTFNEPAFVPVSDEDTYGLYKGVDHFIYGEDSTDASQTDMSSLPPELQKVLGTAPTQFPDVMVKDPETGKMVSYEAYYRKYSKPPKFGGA